MKKNVVINTDYSKEYYSNIAKLNAVIGRKFPNVKLVRGKGYFYIIGKDLQTGLKVAGLKQSGIYGIFNLEDQSVAAWLNNVEELLNQDN